MQVLPTLFDRAKVSRLRSLRARPWRTPAFLLPAHTRTTPHLRSTGEVASAGPGPRGGPRLCESLPAPPPLGRQGPEGRRAAGAGAGCADGKAQWLVQVPHSGTGAADEHPRLLGIEGMAGGGDERALKAWVGDQLIGLLGFSQPAVEAFVLGLGRKHAAAASLADALASQGGLPATPTTRSFAEQLLARMPRPAAGRGAGGSSYVAEERAAAAAARANTRYGLMTEASDAELLQGRQEEERRAAEKKEAERAERKRQKQLRKKRAGDDEGEEEEDAVGAKRGAGAGGGEEAGGLRPAGQQHRKRAKWEEEEAADDAVAAAERAAEAAREADRAEKEAFEERLRARDDAKTSNVAEPKLTAAEAAAAARRALGPDEVRTERGRVGGGRGERERK